MGQFNIAPDGVAHYSRPRPKTEPAPKKPKDRLGWLVKQGHVPTEHLDLGERLLKLNEAKLREPSPHMHFDQGAGGGGGSGALARPAARQKWERLFAVAGPTGEALVQAIIVDGMSLTDAAEYLNINPKAVLPMLRYTLDILART
jgi:hypothetical protein